MITFINARTLGTDGGNRAREGLIMITWEIYRGKLRENVTQKKTLNFKH